MEKMKNSLVKVVREKKYLLESIVSLKNKLLKQIPTQENESPSPKPLHRGKVWRPGEECVPYF